MRHSKDKFSIEDYQRQFPAEKRMFGPVLRPYMFPKDINEYKKHVQAQSAYVLDRHVGEFMIKIMSERVKSTNVIKFPKKRKVA